MRGVVLVTGADRRLVKINYLLRLFRAELRKKSKIKYVTMPQGNVPERFADVSKARLMSRYQPRTNTEENIKNLSVDIFKT